MKKKLMFLPIAVLLLAMFGGVSAFGLENEGYISEKADEFGAGELFDSLDEQTRDKLDSLGVDEIDFSSLIDISPKAFLNSIIGIFSENYQGPLKTFLRLAGVSVLMALADCFKVGKTERFNEIFSIAGCLFVCVITVVPLCDCISNVCSAIKLSSDFMLLFIPAMVAVLVVSGSPMTAAVYNSMLFGVAQVLSRFSQGILMSLTGILMSFNMVACTAPGLNLGGVSKSLRKVITVSLGFTSTIFSGLLTSKGILAHSADSAASNGAKFLAGSFIPVIGSAFGDAIATISSSLAVVKNSFGVFGILAVFVINLPVMAQCVLWISSINLAAVVSGLLGRDNLMKTLKGISQAMTLLLVILLFCVILLIISTALIISLK